MDLFTNGAYLVWPLRYRFMVIDRLGTDLQKKFEECGQKFPRKLVLQLGLRLVSYSMTHLYLLNVSKLQVRQDSLHS